MSEQTNVMNKPNSEKQDEWRDREMGALWRKEGRNQSYLSGKINDKRVIVFENTKKKSDNSPDFVVYESKPMEQSDQSSNGNSSSSSNSENDLL